MGRSLLLGWALLTAPAAWAGDNTGLGPLSVTHFFPPALPYLSFIPEQTGITPTGKWRLHYQYAVSNTFINTEGTAMTPGAAPTFPTTGYRAYIDLEMTRHQVSLRYGLSERLEAGLDMAWVNLGGGNLDANIVGFEHLVGGANPLRSLQAQNGFDYYLMHNNVWLTSTSKPAHGMPQDPVLSLKWAVARQSEAFPAISLKLAYKIPAGSTATLASSGREDYGYYLLMTKQIGSLVAHIQGGFSVLAADHTHFASHVWSQTFAVEFPSGPETAWIFQIVSNSSLFNDDTRTISGAQSFISRPTDLFIFGHKYQGKTFSFDYGLIEDYNQYQNEADFTAFTSMGWTW
ncbi:MAG: DUF3187 family protein [Deltaproteobacteria bacterium]|nr:DUF3187 family protein [Deltaproteobacteria bacterium]